MQDFIETNLVQPLAGVPYAATLVGLLVLALVAWIANWLTRRVLLVVVGRLAKASPTKWDDAIMGRRVLARLAHVVPALIVLGGIALVPAVPEWPDIVVRKVALAYVQLTVGMAIGNLPNAPNDLSVQTSPHPAHRPNKGHHPLVTN